MKILIADAFSDDAVSRLRDAGHDVTVAAGLKDDTLAGMLTKVDPHALVVRSTKVTEAHLDAAKSLELIVRAGAGVNTIDVAGASRRGVFVANCPGKNASAVAELAMGLLISLDRRIPDNVIEARAGRWNKGGFSKAAGLKGRTLGLIGMGSIGQEVARRARAFGMDIVAWSRSLTDDSARAYGVTRADSPADVARVSDGLSVHLAFKPDTAGLINAEILGLLPEGAFLINTARSEVVDDNAIRDAIEKRGLRFATDVPHDEPSGKEGDFASPIADMAYITHHIGASTDEATAAIGDEALRVLLVYAQTGRVANAVNLAEQTPATHLLTVRHLDRVGVLAGVLSEMREAGWNVHEMENLVFAGAEAACARIRFDGTPEASVLARIEAVENVIHATVLAV